MVEVGVDSWRHTRRGDKFVIVVIDLTAVRAGTGPARLLDVVEGRSKQAFKTWLAARDQAWRDQIEVVACRFKMDGFTGFKTATTEELPDAVTVLDLGWTRSTSSASPATPWTRADAGSSRPSPIEHGHRGRAGDPTEPGGPCTPAPGCSPTSSKPGSATSTTTSPGPWSVPAFLDTGLGCQLFDCSVA